MKISDFAALYGERTRIDQTGPAGQMTDLSWDEVAPCVLDTGPSPRHPDGRARPGEH
jgi:hypothetical protein